MTTRTLVKFWIYHLSSGWLFLSTATSFFRLVKFISALTKTESFATFPIAKAKIIDPTGQHSFDPSANDMTENEMTFLLHLREKEFN